MFRSYMEARSKRALSSCFGITEVNDDDDLRGRNENRVRNPGRNYRVTHKWQALRTKKRKRSAIVCFATDETLIRSEIGEILPSSSRARVKCHFLFSTLLFSRILSLPFVVWFRVAARDAAAYKAETTKLLPSFSPSLSSSSSSSPESTVIIHSAVNTRRTFSERLFTGRRNPS